jgi:hypothetical protein
MKGEVIDDDHSRIDRSLTKVIPEGRSIGGIPDREVPLSYDLSIPSSVVAEKISVEEVKGETIGPMRGMTAGAAADLIEHIVDRDVISVEYAGLGVLPDRRGNREGCFPSEELSG